MNTERLAEAMNEVRPDYIAQAAVYEKKRRSIPWGAIAACLCLAAILGLASRYDSLPAGSSAASSGTSHSETAVAYGFLLDGWLYDPITYDERVEFGLVPNTAPTGDDLGQLIGYAQQSDDPTLTGAAVYRWARQPDNERICVVEGSQGNYAYFVAQWRTDVADGADMDAILAAYDISVETVSSAEITDRSDRPVTELTVRSDIETLLSLLPGLTDMGAAAHEARFAALWQETYHTDQVWLDEEGHMHYEGLDKNDWTVYDRAHTLWNSDQRQILLHLTDGRRLWLLYNPAVKSLMIHNSYFALSGSACETLSALLQVF